MSTIEEWYRMCDRQTTTTGVGKHARIHLLVNRIGMVHLGYRTEYSIKQIFYAFYNWKLHAVLLLAKQPLPNQVTPSNQCETVEIVKIVEWILTLYRWTSAMRAVFPSLTQDWKKLGATDTPIASELIPVPARSELLAITRNVPNSSTSRRCV